MERNCPAIYHLGATKVDSNRLTSNFQENKRLLQLSLMSNSIMKTDKLKTDNSPCIKWPKLIRGTLLRRYKRFMVDVKLKNGHVVTAHCPNSGSMLACCEPGRTVFLSSHNNPNRKFKYGFVLNWCLEFSHCSASLVINLIASNNHPSAAMSPTHVCDRHEIAGR